MEKSNFLWLKKGNINEKILLIDDITLYFNKDKLENYLIWDMWGFKVFNLPNKITVSTHGVGCVPMASLVEELTFLGGKTIVRLGCCGALKKDIKLGSTIIPTEAKPLKGNCLEQYFNFSPITTFPSKSLCKSLKEFLTKENISFFEGKTVSSNAFYAEDNLVEDYGTLNYLAVEMENATLFGLKDKLEYKVASVLFVVNNLVDEKETGDHKIILNESIKDISRKLFDLCVKFLEKCC